MSRPVAGLCVLMLFGGVDVAADVRISEVMANPMGSEFRNEFIELANVGHDPVDLAGWRIGDDVSGDRLVFANGSTLDPGAYLLIHDPDYDEGERPYGDLTGFLATVTDRSFGSAGLSNTDPESVYLVDAGGDTVDVVQYEVGEDGRSYEWIEDVAGERQWAFSRQIGGTPGFRNSVSRQEKDLALSFTELPDSTASAGMTVGVELLVVNRGFTVSEPARVEVRGLSKSWSAEVGALAEGATFRVTFEVSGEPGIRVEFEADVVMSGDSDPTNNRVSWTVSFGAKPGSVVINEVMADPAEGSEWIELYNRSERAVDLGGWTVSDGSGRSGRLPDARLEPGRYLVLDDASVTPWPSLNNGGDVVEIRDAGGSLIDEMAYTESETGLSIERIDPSGASDDDTNWLLSRTQSGGTPGMENRAALHEVVHEIVAVSPDPFSEKLTIRASFPDPRSHVTVQVYDRRGRLRRSLLEGVEIGSVLETAWDGRDDAGRPVRPGAYVLMIERSGPDGRPILHRKVVNYTKGL